MYGYYRQPTPLWVWIALGIAGWYFFIMPKEDQQQQQKKANVVNVQQQQGSPPVVIPTAEEMMMKFRPLKDMPLERWHFPAGQFIDEMSAEDRKATGLPPLPKKK